MRLNLIVETKSGRKFEIEGDVTNHGNGNKYLETDDGRGFKLYDDGRIKEICKYGLTGNVISGKVVDDSHPNLDPEKLAQANAEHHYVKAQMGY